jgi:hypothetical protein
MRLATSHENLATAATPKVRMPPCDLRAALDRGVRPAVGFQDPDDVVKDPHLTLNEKRAILCSWASDASAVQDEPRLRWLLGTIEPAPLADVLSALKRLDSWCGDGHRRAR